VARAVGSRWWRWWFLFPFACVSVCVSVWECVWCFALPLCKRTECVCMPWLGCGRYYYWPHHEESYTSKTQYMLGDDMLVAPVVQGMEPNMSVVTGVEVWVPPGEWIDWQTGQVVQGPATINRSFTIKEMGMYIRSGAIITTKVQVCGSGRGGVGASAGRATSRVSSGHTLSFF
jgi:hypothetical protein